MSGSPRPDGRDAPPHSFLYYFVLVIANLSMFLSLPGKAPAAQAAPFRKSPAKLRQISEPAKFFKTFFRKTELNIGPGRYILYRGWRGLRRKPASLSKAGAKVGTFSIPAKFFTHFFQRFFHQNRQPPDSHHQKSLAKNTPPKAPGNPSAANVLSHHYLATLHKKNKQARQRLKTSTRK